MTRMSKGAAAEAEDALTDFRIVLATIATEPAPGSLPVREAGILLHGLPSSAEDDLGPLAMQDVDAFCDRLSDIEVCHPGEVFRESYFPALGMNARACARALGITPAMLSLFMSGKRGISVLTAVKLAKLCGTSPAFWLRHQAMHELVGQAHLLSAQVRRIGVGCKAA